MFKTVPSWNFNTHPELSDQEFATAALTVFNGAPQTNPTVIGNATAFVQRYGRYALIFDPSGGWLAQGYNGNADDDWFLNFPSWTLLLAIPVIAAVGVFMAWKYWGHYIKRATKGGSNGGDE